MASKDGSDVPGSPNWFKKGIRGAYITYSLALGLLVVVASVAFFAPTQTGRVMGLVLLVPAAVIFAYIFWSTTREVRRRRKVSSSS